LGVFILLCIALFRISMFDFENNLIPVSQAFRYLLSLIDSSACPSDARANLEQRVGVGERVDLISDYF